MKTARSMFWVTIICVVSILCATPISADDLCTKISRTWWEEVLAAILCPAPPAFPQLDGFALWIMDANGEQVRQLTGNGDYHFPVFSPHENKIAYVYKQGLWLKEIEDLSYPQLLFDKHPVHMMIAWSQETQGELVFLAGQEFWRVTLGEKEPTLVDRDKIIDPEQGTLLPPWRDPRMSSTGDEVVEYRQDVYIKRKGEPSWINLTGTPGEEGSQNLDPSISSDGTQIVFVSDRGKNIVSPGSIDSIEKKEPTSKRVRQIHADAITTHGDTQEARERFLDDYLATLPQSTCGRTSGETYYFVEGDLRLSKEGVRRYLEDLANGSRADDKPGELLLLTRAGEFVFWKDSDDRQLSYAVDYKSFRTLEEAEKTAKNLQKAAEDWMDVCPECGIEFVRLSSEEAGEYFENAKFVLRFCDDPDGPIAYSFFPHTAPMERELVVFPAYFSSVLSVDPVGVMRHEIGHILGYRHEHIQGTPGCEFEDSQWVPLTPYDPHSVMHYFCGGGGTLQLELSEQDKKGHRCLYMHGGDCPPNE